MRDGGETVLDLTRDAAAGIAEQSGEFFFEPVVLVCLSDEVEDGQAVLAFGQSQAASELLQEDGQGLGRTQEENRIDLRDIDALIVEVDDEDEADPASVSSRRSASRSASVEPPVRQRAGRPCSLQ